MCIAVYSHHSARWVDWRMPHPVRADVEPGKRLAPGVDALTLVVQDQTKLDLDAVVAVWLLDEGDGEEVTDASGNDYEGDFVNNVEWATERFGGALEFDVAGRVEMNNPVATEAEEFTIGCCVRPREQEKLYANTLSSHQAPPQHGMSFEQDVGTNNLYWTSAT